MVLVQTQAVARAEGGVADDPSAVKDAFNTVKESLSGLADEVVGNGDTWKALWSFLRDKVGPFITNTLIPIIAKIFKFYLPKWAKAIGFVIDAMKLQIKFLKSVAKVALWALGTIILWVGKTMQGWAKMLGLLGDVPGFGWAKTPRRRCRMPATRPSVWAATSATSRRSGTRMSTLIPARRSTRSGTWATRSPRSTRRSSRCR